LVRYHFDVCPDYRCQIMGGRPNDSCKSISTHPVVREIQTRRKQNTLRLALNIGRWIGWVTTAAVHPFERSLAISSTP